MRSLPLLAVLSAVSIAAAPAPIKLTDAVSVLGDAAAENGIITIKGAKASLILESGNQESFRLTAEVKAAARSEYVMLQVFPSDLADMTKPAALYGWFYRDLPGLVLSANTNFWDKTKNAWDSKQDSTYCYYWPFPTDKARLAQVENSGLAPRDLNSHWLKLRD